LPEYAGLNGEGTLQEDGGGNIEEHRLAAGYLDLIPVFLVYRCCIIIIVGGHVCLSMQV